VRTGGDGAGGLSFLLLDKNMPGIKIRKMETQFDNTHNTCAVELDDVRVPVRNLIGQEGTGFGMTMTNFNHASCHVDGAAALASLRGSLCCLC
jgi:alkylation response protein AidB-like acyl-CoA dehydrogenase